MTTPKGGSLQQITALEKAQIVRLERAQLKKDLKAGKVSGLELLDHPPDWLETMKVIDFLMALPKVGRVKATQHLHECTLSPVKTIGGMTHRQRKELETALT